jgi:hypothetical protein
MVGIFVVSVVMSPFSSLILCLLSLFLSLVCFACYVNPSHCVFGLIFIVSSTHFRFHLLLAFQFLRCSNRQVADLRSICCLMWALITPDFPPPAALADFHESCYAPATFAFASRSLFSFFISSLSHGLYKR